MSNRTASENSDSISLFPFLAVLLCTMGALLVLLVVFVQGAAERALLPDRPAVAIGATPPGNALSKRVAEQAQLQEELAKIAAYQQELDGLRAEGQRRLESERARLSHAEEHMRRLEEELAKLSIAAEQLKQTEQNQTVDQQQAEEELARLEKLIVETEEQLEALRDNNAEGNKSYAIVPYKGPNGTYRKPIYIECTGSGITIHPEGLRLVEEDFIAPSWPGNPLASILRASREYLNKKAAFAGAPEPPDPYPLILVRPSGIEYYARARAAITSWDSDYGYEFIDEDMKLSFPEAADPQLYRTQNHAMLIARERLVHLVQAAPSRFRGMRMASGPPGAGTSGSGYGGYGSGDGLYGNAGSQVTGAYPGTSEGGSGTGNGNDSLAGQAVAGEAGATSDSQIGNLNGEQAGNAQGPLLGYANGSEAGSDGGTGGNAASGDPSLTQQRYAQQSTDAVGSSQGGPSNSPSEALNGNKSTSGAAGGQQVAGSQQGSMGGSPGGATSGGMSGMSFSQQGSQTIADSKGANWAVERPNLKSVAIRRPISVVVRQNKMIIVPAGGAKRGVEASAQEISLDQPISDISDSFSAAVQERIEDWGLAGSGMYWKPVLELNVEPNAHMTATRIVHLLQDSGVEVQLPDTARANQPVQGGQLR